MSDDWTPIEKAGKYGGPIVLIDRDPIIRRLQDGLITSRAKLAVTVHRPKIYAETSHIDDQLVSAIAGQSFQWGDPVEERESDIELPAAYWASDKLGHAWLDLWYSGDARLESADGNERASFYGLQLLDVAKRNGRRAGNPELDAKPQTNNGDPTEAVDRRWLRISKAVRILHRILKTRLAGQEPAPWIVPPADPFDADCANATHRHRRTARTSLAMRRALLSGDLTAHLVDDDHYRPIPGWAWVNARAAENAFDVDWLLLNPLVDHGLQECGNWRCHVSRSEFNAWVANPGVAELGDLPMLPASFDRACQPEELSYQEPPRKPFIELTQALTWIAFAVSLSRDQFSFLEACRYGPFQNDGWEAAFRAALEKFSSAASASAGSLRVRGRYVGKYVGTNAAGVDTQYLTDTQLRDFARYDSQKGGLERGTGLGWSDDLFEDPFGSKRDGWHDVEVCRAELLSVFPPTVRGQPETGGIVPANRKLNHNEIIKKATSMLANQPGISKGSAAASIVADLSPNPRTGRPRDTRHIERMIAHLWEGGVPQSPR